MGGITFLGDTLAGGGTLWEQIAICQRSCVWRSSSMCSWSNHGASDTCEWSPTKQRKSTEPSLHCSALPRENFGLQFGVFSVCQNGCGEDRASLDNHKLLTDPQEDWADLNSPFGQLGTWLKPNEFHLKACKILNWVKESINLCWWQNKGLAMKLQVKAATGRFRHGVTTRRIWLSPWHRHLACV